jgi:methyl-accepting chemotaxis protein
MVIKDIMSMVSSYRNDFKAVVSNLLEVEEVSIENNDYVAALVVARHKMTQMVTGYVNNMTESMDNLPGVALKVMSDLTEENHIKARLTLFISIGIYALLAIATVSIALYIPKLLSKPLVTLSKFMKKAGATGDLTLEPADVKIIGEMSNIKDEIGMTISGASALIGHITRIADELETIASGDLTIEVETLSDKDKMGNSLYFMVDSLNRTFSEIDTSAQQVTAGSKQVSNGAQNLAKGSTEQAGSIQQLSESIAEIAEKTKGNAATADKTSKLSTEIKENAEKGSRQMNEMMSAVHEINEANHSISKIIRTIDDIAFQTNILALNAAVEAARAGQHGKGFAVVAEEVRNLAVKSAEAAKETGNMIQSTMEKAEFGACIASDTVTSFSEIVTGIKESSDLIAEIARASEEQSQGISHINNSIDQVTHIVQQNSATAEESAAASEEMSSQSDVLQEMISQFKIKKAGILNRSIPEYEVHIPGMLNARVTDHA